jgi:hypothetical protein
VYEYLLRYKHYLWEKVPLFKLFVIRTYEQKSQKEMRNKNKTKQNNNNNNNNNKQQQTN